MTEQGDDATSSGAPASYQSFESWKGVCDDILAKPFPPHSSDFPPESLERDSHVNLSGFSNWQIVCEEILDTEFSHVYYQKCHAELRNRGKSEEEIFEMRRFAWYVAGWLNFPMMVWDWVDLDEVDIRLAIRWLFDQGQIDQQQRVEFERFVSLHAGR